MKKKINSIALVLNSLYLLYLILKRILLFSSTKSMGSIGIIGGADGPTTIYVIPSVAGVFQVLLVLFFEFVFIVNLRKQRPK
jgi:Na+-transporting methylmalonyl-CoA/oxaloacetate decarboxylase beta subunit